MNQITTFTLFKVESLANKWWAFKQMQIGIQALKEVSGLCFFKMLGSGANRGFSPIPNFGTYVLLCVWDSEEDANLFFATNPFFKQYQLRSKEVCQVFLHPAEVHGKWDDEQPFILSAQLSDDKPVAVLTRATIRFSKLFSFWRRVGNVSKSLDSYEGLVLSIGVGEWPLIQQATISIWRTKADMLHYAYKNQKHKEVVLLTRKLNWYKEEMFARFVPFKLEGVWKGKPAGQLLN